MASTTATDPRRTLVVRRIILAAISVFLIFEIGIRFVPADGMTDTATDKSGRVVYQYSTTNQAVVSSWQGALNTAPRRAGLDTSCILPEPVNWVAHTYTFTWRGIPVESAWSNSGGSLLFWMRDDTACPAYIMSNGGIPDIFLRSTPQQEPPAESPNSP